ncbi:aryl-alcohol dehydrogenase-like predicted oxidoreductase [Sphingomonas kyeonggiensis]|uniref:Aryl-alcohol dehydrogenase-like predicted oxidoreductase n=1 Tax=Sphingomonas kyeonggiensis TaxID=1268553 RepID=A0A7W7JZU2_9SPHN|nr:aldo/keto reductase [Sphingomonas kyeonggiensis]MBB4838451.1 aryl-alcohol dehydrogenase-like predicted oxidoreductase [Sphingomonas kyeonggiensis]
MTNLRDLGASGIQTPSLILGGNVFGWTADKATSFAILDRFAEAGGTLVDTADVYSAWVPGHQGGESEAIIGEWLKGSGKQGKIKVATKVGMLDGEGGTKLAPARIAAACDASLKRLGVETIDLYFAHQDDEDVPQEEVLAAFDTLIKAGKVQAIAASNFHAMRLKSALDIATREGLPHYRALQNEYHLLSRHKYEGELQDLCVEYNIGCVPYYGLASGYLTGKYRSEADLGKSVRGGRMTAFMEGKGPAMLAALDEIAAETGATLAQIALAWLAAQPGVTAPIASATSVAQAEELVGSWNVTLGKAQLDRLTAAGA